MGIVGIGWGERDQLSGWKDTHVEQILHVPILMVWTIPGQIPTVFHDLNSFQLISPFNGLKFCSRAEKCPCFVTDYVRYCPLSVIFAG